MTPEQEKALLSLPFAHQVVWIEDYIKVDFRNRMNEPEVQAWVMKNGDAMLAMYENMRRNSL